jgi:hypothetical protein
MTSGGGSFSARSPRSAGSRLFAGADAGAFNCIANVSMAGESRTTWIEADPAGPAAS